MTCQICVGGAIHCNRGWFLDEAARLRALADEHEKTAEECLHPEHEKMGREHRKNPK